MIIPPISASKVRTTPRERVCMAPLSGLSEDKPGRVPRCSAEMDRHRSTAMQSSELPVPLGRHWGEVM